MAARHRSIALYLIRSGESSWAGEGRLHGSTDLPLSEAGRTAVKASLARLALANGNRPLTIHHPEDEAASETARLCAARMGAKTRALSDLHDPNLGLLEGLRAQDFAERYPSRHRMWIDDPLALSPPEGEEIMDAANRLFTCIARLLRRLRNDETAVVLHPMGIGLLRCWLADRPLNEFRAINAQRPAIEHYLVPVPLLKSLEQAGSAAIATE